MTPNDRQPALDAEGLFLAHRATVYRWATALGADHQLALDTVQEAFLRLIRAAPACPTPAAQLAWLRRTTVNLIADHRRSGRASHRPLRLTADPPAPAQCEIDTESTRNALEGLSEMQRLVLVAKLCDNLTFAQIAAELDVAIPTVKTHYLRALTAVRNRLGIQVPTHHSGAAT